MSEVRIRCAVPDDAHALLAIYSPYVTDTAITFEYTVPSEDEFRARMIHTLERYPYLVAEVDGEPVGYACTGPFKTRAAYDWAVETTIYVRREFIHHSIGRKLAQALEDVSRVQHICNLYACISCPEVEDETLTRNSMDFHAHIGYTLIGLFHHCGSKFGRWYHMVWMEKLIGSHAGPPEPVIPFRDLPESALLDLGIDPCP